MKDTDLEHMNQSHSHTKHNCLFGILGTFENSLQIGLKDIFKTKIFFAGEDTFF